MESRIRLLSEATANRIAAGEVIERPAAAVKELIENALDAGARRITIALDAGGIDRIEVTDDGVGMNPVELALAVQRHATSKMTDETLVRIATLGFRGEALPAIGAAARLSIISRSADAPHAAIIRVEASRVSEVEPCAGPAGTRIVARDLFFATPARRKFLKHPRTEAEHAEGAVRRLAMAAPNVAFRLEIDGRIVFDLPAEEPAQRLAALLGPVVAAAMVPVSGLRGMIEVGGFAGSPGLTRATMAGQFLVVNGRPVADPVLRIAVRLAYRDVLTAGRHPVVALSLTLPAEELDVNVHPAKTELRFRDANAVRSVVMETLTRALAGGAATAMPTPRPDLSPSSGFGRPALSLVQSRPPSRGAWRPSPGGFAEPALPFGGSPAARVLPMPSPVAVDHPLGAPVAQVLDTYVIAVAADGSLVLVDQHAAHERLTHETLRAQMVDGGVRAQALLLPGVVEMDAADAARLLARIDELSRLGLEIEAFGAGAILVRALPAALGTPDPAPLLQDLADELAEMEESAALATRLDAVIARLACHGSIRAGRRLAPQEMNALLRQMEATPRAATCSHGRPTFLKLTRAEIERLFGRR